MKKLIFFGMFCIPCMTGISAQDCNIFYPATVNAQLEYAQFDRKGDPAGSSVQKITDVKQTAGSTEVSVIAENFDTKGKSLGSLQLKARCEGGVFYIDMKNYMSQQSMESFEDMEMTIEGGSLEMPSSMKAGDVLKSGDLKMSFSGEGMPPMGMTISITNRKVEAVENITTPAGTFECYKISFDMATTMMMMNIKAKGTEWFSKGVGMVKSESYTADGKLAGSTQLKAIKK